MYCRILAFDFDGTLAEHGVVPPALQVALQRIHAAGHILFLVTGRRFGDVNLGALEDVFTGIVWENGAVLTHTASGEVYLPFGTLDPRLIQELEAAHVPLEHGQTIVATWIQHADTVWHVLQHWGADATVVQNKGALMILPPGATKGTGLEHMLGLCGLSRHNLVAFGDAENDISLFELSGCGVAVADAVPALKEVADLVTNLPGPAGVLEVLKQYWIDEQPLQIPLHRQPQIPLGVTEAGTPVAISGATLISSNLGIFGDSGSGKSWVAGLLAEGMHHFNYQVLLIDPEGDFRGLRGLPGIIAVEGDAQTLPAPTHIAALLEVSTASVVLDLCHYPIDQRNSYLVELLHSVQTLRKRTFRPHWIVLEEAQQFVQPGQVATLQAIQPLLNGGWAFVSYRPDWLAPAILRSLNSCLLTQLTNPEAIAAIQRVIGNPCDTPADIPQGYVWMCERCVVQLRTYRRRITHIRHLYKYLNAPLPMSKRFFFNTAQGSTGFASASLGEFLDALMQVPLTSLEYHQARGDFVAWAEQTLGDGELAGQLRKLAHRKITGDALRAALVQRVGERYTLLQNLR